jgi:hypothetical protein
MAIERVRICGACERECPGWANRCPVCGSLSLVHRVTFVPAASPGAELVSHTAARKAAPRPRNVAARDAKVRKTPFAGEPETRAV